MENYYSWQIIEICDMVIHGLNSFTSPDDWTPQAFIDQSPPYQITMSAIHFYSDN